jgi:hypothetical protein
MSLLQWLSARFAKKTGIAKRPRFRPYLEVLEDRTAPAVITWGGGGLTQLLQESRFPRGTETS